MEGVCVCEIQFITRVLLIKGFKAMEAGEASNGDLLSILLDSNFQEIEQHGNKSFGMTIDIDEVVEEWKLFYCLGISFIGQIIQNGRQKLPERVVKSWVIKPDYDGLNHFKTYPPPGSASASSCSCSICE